MERKTIAEHELTPRGVERFRAAMDASPDCVLLIDPASLRFVDANRATERTLGYTREELLAMGPQDLARASTRKDFTRLFADLAHGPPEGCMLETACLHKDGSEHPVEARFTRFAPPDAAPLVIAVARDITERRRAEQSLSQSKELLEHMFESIHVLVAYLDRDFNFIRVNRAYAENETIFRRVVETGEPYIALGKAFEYAEHPERGVSYWDW